MCAYTHIKLRSKLQKPSHKHIIDTILEYKIDPILARTSSAVFEFTTNTEQNREYRRILSILAEKGPMTEFKVGKHSEPFGLNRDAVRRRILGTNTLLSLAENEFLVLRDRRKLNFKKEKRFSGKFHLTIKGLFASLRYTKFENNYLMKNYYTFVKLFSGNEFHFADFAIQYVKFFVAVILYWHWLNGINLTNQKSTNLYLNSWCKENPVLELNYVHDNPQNNPEEKKFLEIRQKFFVIKNIVFFLLDKLEDPSICRSYIEYWLSEIYDLQFEDIENYNPYEPHIPFPPSAEEMVDETTIKKETKRILNRLHLS